MALDYLLTALHYLLIHMHYLHLASLDYLPGGDAADRGSNLHPLLYLEHILDLRELGGVVIHVADIQNRVVCGLWVREERVLSTCTPPNTRHTNSALSQANSLPSTAS